ncbi:MAG: hypothetical protein PHU14_03195 [Methylovulum sp.]|nr:hypothetical protein [Methylovulum sp.]
MTTPPRLAMFTGLCIMAATAFAGTLKKDGWEASGCGAKPVAPELNYESIPAFNDSVAALDAWQQTTVPYFECLVKEAAADIKKISDTVSQQQKDHKEFVEAINAEAAAVKQRVESDNVLPPMPEQQ